MYPMLAMQALALADDSFEVTADTTTTAASGGIVAAIVGFGIFFWLFAIVLGVFTIWMFIDALIRPDADYEKVGSGSKIMWALLIFFLGFIPAVIYWFVVRKKAKAGAPAASK